MALDTTRDGALPMEVARPPARRRLGWLGGLLAALAVGAVAVMAWPRIALPPAAPAAETHQFRSAEGGPAPVLAMGRLVPRSRVITIAPPFGGGDARLAELRVREGDTVEEGAILATLDSAPALAAALAAAEAQRAQREAALAQTMLAVATSLAEAEAALARAEASLPVLRRDLERAEALAARGATPAQTLDQRRLAHAQAEQDAARARAALARHAGSPDTQPDILLARRNLDAAAAERDRAAADLARATIRAPSAGTVLTLHARPGERPGNAGLMTFARLDDMIAEIEVHEDRVARLRAGAPVTLVSPALEAPLHGTLAHLGREVQRQTLTDPSPAAATDARVVRAVVALEGEAARRAAALVNLQVTARITP
ncbi:HlyD family efflux transporter periplasmic adaptor subunit [Roseococcus thiosulfatophilus]|uniref:HlyD family efflux transporter periplasmic adaptor subunit n=1 Tax=Roseococcus thiosulfatophilus TaxID=35813 RepID=UPI001A8E6ED8